MIFCRVIGVAVRSGEFRLELRARTEETSGAPAKTAAFNVSAIVFSSTSCANSTAPENRQFIVSLIAYSPSDAATVGTRSGRAASAGNVGSPTASIAAVIISCVTVFA